MFSHAAAQLGDKATFDTWIRQLSFVPGKGNEVCVPVSNVYLADEYRRSYKHILEEAFLQAGGKYVEISFIVDPLLPSPSSVPVPEGAPQETSAQGLPRLAPTHATQLASSKRLGPFLNPEYSFDQFIVGPCNRLAHAAAMAVAENPFKAYNPLFVHGAVGLGKTHLLQAVCFALMQRFPHYKVEYLPCETFVNAYVSAVKKQQLEEFRGHLRNLDVLAIDDIRFLRGKEGSQEETFHTFNALHAAQKQMLFSSDSKPEDVPTLEDRLVNRFNWGMVARLDAPSFEVRMAIIKTKTAARGFPLSDELAEHVANVITTNMRDLHGAAAKIAVRASLTGHPIDKGLIDEALSDSIRTPVSSVSFNDILTAVCRYFNLPVHEIESARKVRSVALPRQVAMYLLKQLTSNTLEEIGALFGGKDHSTVLHAINKIRSKTETDIQFKLMIEQLTSQLAGR